MRRCILLLILLATPAGGAGEARAAAPFLKASPNPVGFGETLVVKGRRWPVIEFCRRRVTISLRSDQNAFRLGSVRVRDSGRFRFEYTVRRGRVGAGSWTLQARMRCESGDDGSPNPIRRQRTIEIQ